jgi:molybdate transport system ATP-binding protein
MTVPFTCRSTRLSFGGFSLDADIDTVLAGTTALFGPSGGGKSTLLRIIAGLESRAEGQVVFDGNTWADSARGIFLPAHRRPVGFVFQDGRLFPHLDVMGNLRYADKRSRGGAGSITRPAVIDALDLAPLLTRRPDSLSGGERQRVALGRTLLTRPRLLLLDEPLSALDIGRKAAILPYLRDVPRTFGIPALYVSHAIEEVAQIAETLIVMAEGRIRAIGPTAELLERVDLQSITGRFEAGALLSARVTAQDDAYRLTRLDLEGRALTMPMLPTLAPGETVRLRVRARDVSLALARPDGLSIRNILPGTVDSIAPEPDTAFAEVSVAIGTQRLRARITREAVDALCLVPGAAVFVLVKSASFDRRGLVRA